MFHRRIQKGKDQLIDVNDFLRQTKNKFDDSYKDELTVYILGLNDNQRILGMLCLNIDINIEEEYKTHFLEKRKAQFEFLNSHLENQ
jgi:predicted transcriptional regulator YheO